MHNSKVSLSALYSYCIYLNHISNILQDGIFTTNKQEIYSKPKSAIVVGQSTFADIGKIFFWNILKKHLVILYDSVN